MLGVSHLLISGTAVSLILGTADPVLISIGSIAGLLPDIDVSTSLAGRLFPWIAGYFESTMPHRSCTHSIVASAVVAIACYSTTIFIPKLLPIANALTIGYTFGWFADCFTRSGVEMFWPSSIRCVCPSNRNLRLKTGSNAEYFVLTILMAIAISIFSINNNGGLLNQFNRLIASTSGAVQIYNQSGSNHKIIANIKGVRSIDRVKINGQFLIIKELGQGFVVLDEKDNKLYKASTEPDAQIIVESITADVGKPAITTIENIFLDDEPIGGAIAKYQRSNSMVFISGQLNVDDFDTSILPRDPYQFKFIDASPTNINLEAAPLEVVLKFLGDEFVTGNLQIRSIVSSH